MQSAISGTVYLLLEARSCDFITSDIITSLITGYVISREVLTLKRNFMRPLRTSKIPDHFSNA